ncbi:MAG: F0F1 ATP synthase subunit A [Phycisphaerales bacterium]|nr:F0F1 ATP synthase subunit A [Phycisphaerales bacterium]
MDTAAISPSLFTLATENNPLLHVLDHPFSWGESSGVWYWSSHVGMIALTGLVMLILFPLVARKIATGSKAQGTVRYVTQGSFAHLVEVICVYLRDQVVKPVLGERTDRFMPYLWTLFFFILLNNLLGMIPIMDLLFLVKPSWRGAHIAPIGGTATANIWVTGGLALVAFLVINISGIRELGVAAYCKHFLGGAPAYLAPLMIPVEILGMLVKPSALMIRLFANMNAGHILLATLLMFVKMSFEGLGAGGGLAISIPSMLFAFAIYFLEIFVAFLQAFIFMFLTTIFISQFSHHGEEQHEHDDRAHGEPVAAH